MQFFRKTDRNERKEMDQNKKIIIFTDAWIKILKIKSRDGLEVDISQSYKIYSQHPQNNGHKIHFGHLIVLILPNSHHTPSNTNRIWTRLNATPLRSL